MEHACSPPVFDGVRVVPSLVFYAVFCRVAPSLVFYAVFCRCCLSFFGHCVFCSSIYGF